VSNTFLEQVIEGLIQSSNRREILSILTHMLINGSNFQNVIDVMHRLSELPNGVPITSILAHWTDLVQNGERALEKQILQHSPNLLIEFFLSPVDRHACLWLYQTVIDQNAKRLDAFLSLKLGTGIAHSKLTLFQ
jgi:hypothetical protein